MAAEVAPVGFRFFLIELWRGATGQVGKRSFAMPVIMIPDESTRGIDVGTKFETFQIINQLVAEG